VLFSKSSLSPSMELLVFSNPLPQSLLFVQSWKSFGNWRDARLQKDPDHIMFVFWWSVLKSIRSTNMELSVLLKT
jgi:hypothetical protein